jgi:hypothetical protein
VEVGCEDTTSFLLSKIKDHLVAPCASSFHLASWVTFLSSWIFADSSRRGPRLVAAPDWARLLSCSWLAASCVFVFGLRINLLVELVLSLLCFETARKSCWVKPRFPSLASSMWPTDCLLPVRTYCVEY